MATKMIAALIACCLVSSVWSQYQPTWQSLDSRPLPSWYDEAKVGIFIHWGVFSAPGFGSPESAFLWYYWMNHDKVVVDYITKNYPSGFTYGDFAPTFRGEFFNPDYWADIFKAAGAKYVVLTSKHVEGFTNWPSKVSWNWNSVDVGPKRDLVGDLAEAIRRRTDIHFGLYHSLFEWFNPLYIADKSVGFTTRKFPEGKTLPELYELVNIYKPELIWSDGDWEAPDTYWNSTGFLAWLYNESPVKDYVVTNDRWGIGTQCRHGGYLTCYDHFNPHVLQKHKWENCLTIDRLSWGYRRNAVMSDFRTTLELLTELVTTVSCGGNILINVGPTGDGMISPMFEDRLRDFGDWLKVNGEAIYATKPWTHQNDTVTSYVWYTSKKTASETIVYAISLAWPKDNLLILGAVNTTPGSTVSLIGYGGPMKWANLGPSGGITVTIPPITIDQLPCRWAWAFKLTNLAS
jgi:alpha-L-fucosidase